MGTLPEKWNQGDLFLWGFKISCLLICSEFPTDKSGTGIDDNNYGVLKKKSLTYKEVRKKQYSFTSESIT